jgi:hypothetical protein
MGGSRGKPPPGDVSLKRHFSPVFFVHSIAIITIDPPARVGAIEGVEGGRPLDLGLEPEAAPLPGRIDGDHDRVSLRGATPGHGLARRPPGEVPEVRRAARHPPPVRGGRSHASAARGLGLMDSFVVLRLRPEVRRATASSSCPPRGIPRRPYAPEASRRSRAHGAGSRTVPPGFFGPGAVHGLWSPRRRHPSLRPPGGIPIP